mgnify:CR=1 FL=1
MPNEEQLKFWDNEGGEFWAGEADDLDIFLSPLNDVILTAADLKPGEKVLDIGCGPGALTLAAAALTGSALGIDLSSQLISVGKSRASLQGSFAEFIHADAATYQADLPADVLISRIGVMFFDQPIEAFAKLRKGATHNARMVFASWAPISQNPWIKELLAPLKSLLPNGLPDKESGTPGPFSLSEPHHVKAVLSKAGWKDISVSTWEDTLGVPADSPEQAASFFAKINPAARTAANQGAPEEEIISRLTTHYQKQLERDGDIIIRGAALLVTAKV